MTARPLAELIDRGWAAGLEPVAEKVAEMGAFLRSEIAAGRSYLPAGPHILRAFERPLSDVRVLIVGQDPYLTPGHAVGLSFSVAPEVRPIPRSLANIYRELSADLGVDTPKHGDLSVWADRGILLLNRCLTVQPGNSGAHRGKGWETVTDRAIDVLVGRDQPLVAVLWGKDAQTLRPRLGTVPVVASVHPSPMSADRGFFGSRPFSQVNTLLGHQGAEPINWQIP